MTSYANPAKQRPGDVVNTLRLLACLALSIALMVGDHRGEWLSQFRGHANVAMQPLWWLAGLPSRLGRSFREDAATRGLLAEDNARLRNELLVSNARLARLQAAAVENTRLRSLLEAVDDSRLDVQLAPILDIDLDPTRHRLVLRIGSRQGVVRGQSVIDAGGVIGQVIDTTQTTATVLLVTDLDHAIPVEVERTGVRLVVYGEGRSDRLSLPNVPMSSDIEIGDRLITSGIGGRFPPGFPVGEVTNLEPDDSRAFLLGHVQPAAQLDRGRDVLLLRELFEVLPPPRPSPESGESDDVDAIDADAEASSGNGVLTDDAAAGGSTP